MPTARASSALSWLAVVTDPSQSLVVVLILQQLMGSDEPVRDTLDLS